ncbi:MAG TPA: MMPL family transporter, partial [Nitrososphaerales archaeon]|nr:MMPL family transporter [Nitrososphaerales archaeon]
ALKGNLSFLDSNLFGLKNGINQSALLIYGIPANFVLAWRAFVAQGANATQANTKANQSVYGEISTQGSEALRYYSLFYNSWNSTFQSSPNLTLADRETFAVNNATSQFVQSPLLDNATKGLILAVEAGLNVTNWNQESAIGNLTVNTFSSSIPSSISSSLGVSALTLTKDVYMLGPNATSSALSNLSVKLLSSTFPNIPASSISISALVNDSASLGPSPSAKEIWNLASGFFSNVTASSFSTSPLFTINATSLPSLLSGLENASTNQVRSSINNVIATVSYVDYPIVLSSSITRNFVSQNNGTMIVLFNYSSQPGTNTISGFRNDLKNSNISILATTYVTGSPVLSQDVQDAFTPALDVTIIPGILVSILIVGLLFLAPLAALVPLLIGGLSIAIAYPAIYLSVVVIGKGQITFLTPTLTTLLMLGLAVDYSVLQLRRTKEERMNGKTKEESVAMSVRWAGEAVITAGITVIVAYIVMAVANVPLFSDVGTAIALGVSILLLASITLLPSLELSIGDKLFWPSLKPRGHTSKRSMLERISEGTSRHKVLVAVVVTLLAAGAIYISQSTPTGVDLLKLIPNFQSNQGLTVITNSLGSATIAPSIVVLTTSTPIVYGHNQFNQTLLSEIELISSTATSSSGVVSVTSPTRPYGSAFNYASIQNFTEPLQTQYLSGMLAQIGKNNKTALISVGLSSGSESAEAVSSLLGVEKRLNALPLSNVVLYYGGATQETYDSQSFINGILPQVIIILAAAVYVILFLQLRSIFTPLRLVFTILCSVAFALAILSISFFYVLGLPILDFAPLFVVVTMLGVGIDYDIFFVTRIREEVLGGKGDNEAIKTATSKIWVTILGLGLVLGSVFGSLVVTGIAVLQEIS